MIAEALAQCLSPRVEAALIKVIDRKSAPIFVRKHAVCALAHGVEPSSRRFLLNLFLSEVGRKQSKREFEIYRVLLRAMGHLNDKRAILGLLQALHEERESSYLDCMIATVTSLGELGDKRAMVPLRNLLNTDWVRQAPTICLALAKLRDPKSRQWIATAKEKARGKWAWTPWQRKTFKKAEQLASRQRRHIRPQSRG